MRHNTKGAILRFYGIDIIGTLVIWALVIIFQFGLAPFDRFFVERDPTLSYPYILPNDQQVPTWLLFTISLGTPLVLVVLAQLMAYKFPWQVLLPTHLRENLLLPYLTILQSWGLTGLITVLAKFFVGRKRPNFFAMCNYQGYRDALNTGNWTFYLSNTVAGNPGDIKHCLESSIGTVYESMSSFPSGHSSLTFAGLTVVFWMMLGSIPLSTQSRTIWQFRLWRTFPLILFLGSSTLVALGRTRDYWHNFDDILAGSVLGIGVASFIFYANTHLRSEEKNTEQQHLLASEVKPETL